MMPDADFQNLVDAINDALDTGDPVRIAVSACRALGFAAPKSALRGKQPVRRAHPPMPWSPFSLA
jgi:hypothetical protein